MRAKHALVCVNGDCHPQTLSRLNRDSFDLLVAVDGGLRHLEAIGWSPDWLVGDLDSIDPDTDTRLLESGTRVHRHPVEKDATDLELALSQVAALAVNHVTLIGLSGGRLDHGLANLLLLGRFHWPFGIHFYTNHGNGCVITPERPFAQTLSVKSELSLLPLSADVSGVTCTGLYYPLQQARIELGSTLGISNVVVSPEVSVFLQSGSLLLLHNSADIFSWSAAPHQQPLAE